MIINAPIKRRRIFFYDKKGRDLSCEMLSYGRANHYARGKRKYFHRNHKLSFAIFPLKIENNYLKWEQEISSTINLNNFLAFLFFPLCHFCAHCRQLKAISYFTGGFES